MSALKKYWVYVGRHLQPFSCPLCAKSVLAKQFEQHCLALHHLNPQICCVWCCGHVSWPPGQKTSHADHLTLCMRLFLHPPSAPPLPRLSPATDFVPFDLTPMDRKRSLFLHAFAPLPGDYDTYRLPPLDSVPLSLQNDALTLAVACVRTYLRLRETTEWYHVMVRKLAFPAFVRALDNPHVFTLPFSCWCNGGKPTEARLRQHRHFILVSSPVGHFATWIKTIVPEDRPRENFRCFYSKRILSPMHLVNTIGYTCKRASRCEFSKKNTKAPKKLNHFYLFEELPKDYRLPLVLQWEGGLNQLLRQQYREFKRRELVEAPLFHESGQWRLKVRDIPGIALGTVLPVARDFEPCEEETDAFVYLMGGRKLFFKRNPELLQLDPEAWHRRQADRGNAFFHAVSDDTWTPRPLHQALIHEFKPLVDCNRDLEARFAQHTQDAQTLVHRNQELEARLAQQALDAQALVHRNQDLEARLAQHTQEDQTLVQELEARLSQQALDAQALAQRNLELEACLAQQTLDAQALAQRNLDLEACLAQQTLNAQALQTHYAKTCEALELERKTAREALENELDWYKKKYAAAEEDNRRMRDEENERLRFELTQYKK